MNDFTIDRYTAAQMAQIVGRKGQVAVDLTNNNLVVHDGVTRGGVPALNAAGTTTLTNKTISLANNTLTGTVAQFNTAMSDADFATLDGSETLTNKTLTTPKLNDNLILPIAASTGFKYDHAAPAYGWADIIGAVQPKATGVGSPTRTSYIGNIADYAFVLNDVCDFVYHIPHSHVPNTDLLWHIHWSHNGTNISGNVVFTAYFTYASRTLAGTTVFTSEKTITVTFNTTDLATTPRYAHRVDEVQITSAGGSASTLDKALIEVDGLILLTLKVTTLPTITGGSLFVHTSDIHHQSTGLLSTKNSAPNYYN